MPAITVINAPLPLGKPVPVTLLPTTRLVTLFNVTVNAPGAPPLTYVLLKAPVEVIICPTLSPAVLVIPVIAVLVVVVTKLTV